MSELQLCPICRYGLDRYDDTPHRDCVAVLSERLDKAVEALEVLRAAQVTHSCANCERTGRERDEARALARKSLAIVEAASDEEVLSWRGHDATGLLLELQDAVRSWEVVSEQSSDA